MKLHRVKLRKDLDYIYCFLREDVILEQDCDMYEYNLECDRKSDYWGRTHRKGTAAGYTYQDVAGQVLNSCNYCNRVKEVYKEYILPQEAKIYKSESKMSKFAHGLFR